MGKRREEHKFQIHTRIQKKRQSSIIIMTDVSTKVAGERWAALESNPEVMTKLCHQLGVSSMFDVVDVWGLDPDMLGFVPKPVVSLILLFPSKSTEDEDRRVTVPDHEMSSQVYYLTQLKGHLDNACGTIAMIHSIMNNRDILGVADNKESVGERFYEATKSNAVESEKVCHHFVCITSVNGHLVELDGAYNSGPNIISKIPDGDGFLECAAKFVKEKYISANADAQFALMALVMAQN